MVIYSYISKHISGRHRGGRREAGGVRGDSDRNAFSNCTRLWLKPQSVSFKPVKTGSDYLQPARAGLRLADLGFNPGRM